MGLIRDGLTDLIEFEKEYGSTPEGIVLIDGMVTDALNLLPWPFQIKLSFVSFELDRTKMETFITSLLAKVRTYITASQAEPSAGG